MDRWRAVPREREQGSIVYINGADGLIKKAGWRTKEARREALKRESTGNKNVSKDCGPRVAAVLSVSRNNKTIAWHVQSDTRAERLLLAPLSYRRIGGVVAEPWPFHGKGVNVSGGRLHRERDSRESWRVCKVWVVGGGWVDSFESLECWKVDANDWGGRAGGCRRRESCCLLWNIEKIGVEMRGVCPGKKPNVPRGKKRA